MFWNCLWNWVPLTLQVWDDLGSRPQAAFWVSSLNLLWSGKGVSRLISGSLLEVILWVTTSLSPHQPSSHLPFHTNRARRLHEVTRWASLRPPACLASEKKQFLLHGMTLFSLALITDTEPTMRTRLHPSLRGSESLSFLTVHIFSYLYNGSKTLDLRSQHYHSLRTTTTTCSSHLIKGI